MLLDCFISAARLRAWALPDWICGGPRTSHCVASVVGLTAKWWCQTSLGRESSTLDLYEEKGEFGEISDLSTFVLDFLAIFFTASAAFFAAFFASFFADLPFLAI
jgi:hypothetical protein